MILEVASLTIGTLGVLFGLACYRIARMWQRDCREARIIIAVKNRVQLDAPLVEWLAWNKALPKRERGRGGIIFQHSGVRVALARPKVMAHTGVEKVSSTSRTVDDVQAKKVEAVA